MLFSLRNLKSNSLARYPLLNMLTPTLQLPRPPWTKVGKKLESMCRKALYEFDLLQGCPSLAIALSGGKDSLALLFLLKGILGNGFPNIPLHAIHVSGEFSCGASLQTGFIQNFCDQLSVPLTICHSTQTKETLACYRCSRERRRLIFEAAKNTGAKTIAFGHHSDDSIQTLLLNLLHKGEFAANLAKVPMHDYGITIIRPLIYIAEKEIIAFAKHYGFARITCQCPIGQQSKRQEVKNIIKILEESFPNASQNLFHASLKYGSKKALEKREKRD